MKKIFLYFSFLYLGLILCPIASELFKIDIHNSVYQEVNAQTKNKEKQDKQNSVVKSENKQSKENKDSKSPETAEDTLYTYDKPEAEEVSYGWLIFKTLIVLGLLGFGFYMFFRFITKKVGVPSLGKNIVQLLAISPIGQGKFIQVVDIAGKILVLGVTDNNINLITEITEKDEIDRIKLLNSKSVTEQGKSTENFQEFIKNQIGNISEIFKSHKTSENTRRKKHSFNDFVNDDSQEDNKLDYLKKQKDRLKKLNGSHDE